MNCPDCDGSGGEVIRNEDGTMDLEICPTCWSAWEEGA